MKKIKFNKKTKLFLSAITLTATSAAVLAACGPKPIPAPTPKEEKGKATQQQLDFVNNNLIANKGFLKLLSSAADDSWAEFAPALDKVIEIKDFNGSKLTESKKALGQKTDAKSTVENSSLFANLKTLQENYETKKANTTFFSKPEDSTELKAKLNAVSTDAEALLSYMNKNVISDSDKEKLNAKGESLKKLLEDYVNSKKADAAKINLTEFKKNWKELQADLKDVFKSLSSLSESGLKLDRSVNELTAFIQTKTPKFLKTAGGSSDDAEVKTALEKLSLNSKTKILGTLGKDYWSQETDAPKTIEEGKSTGLYSINALLNATRSAFHYANHSVIEITLNKDLSLKEEAAINLLALHIDQKVPEDALRLNAYLLNNDSNLEKVLKDNLFATANTVGSGTVSYAKFVGGENSDFVKALTTAEAAETDTTKKAKITAIKTAFLKTDGVSKALEAFYKTNVLTAAAELQPKVLEVNESMSLAINFGDTLKVRGQLNYLQDYVVTPLEEINKSVTEQEKNTSKLFDDLKTKLEETTAGNLKAAVDAYLSATGYQADVTTTLDPYFKKTGENYTGYYYTLTKGTEKTETVAKQLSLTELKTELAKFETGADKPLTKGVDLLKQQLKNSFETETGDIMHHLYHIYNNGDVLEDHHHDDEEHDHDHDHEHGHEH